MTRIKNKYKNWYRSMLARTVLLAGTVIIFTLSLYLFFIIPFQKEAAIERMDIEANGLASSIAQVTTNAIILEDYAFAVGHCLPIVSENSSIEYIVITKNDGFSLVHKKDSWNIDNFSGMWIPDDNINSKGYFLSSDLVNSEVYHYSYRFEYSGIKWGWIHLGLNLNAFNNKIDDMILTSVWLALLCMAVGLTLSIFFASKFSQSIKLLDQKSKQIAEGNLTGTVDVRTTKELESFSNSFNTMTNNLAIARNELETRVKERTSELAEANEALQEEIIVRIDAENLLHRNNLRLEALQDIYRGIISAKSSKEILKESIIKVNQVLSFVKAGAALFNFKENSAILIKTKNFDTNALDEKLIFNLTDFASINLFKDSDYYIVEDLEAKEDKSIVEQKMLNEYGIRSYICAALKFQNKLLGEINLGSNKLNAFSEEEKNIITEIASQLAVAIEQANLREELKSHATNLQNSLTEKVVLLKEIHHRVKNNMQIISSLLYLQSKNIADDKTLSIYKDSQNRIKSMALVHEKLYQSKDFSNINFNEYVKNLVSYINQSYLDLDKKVEIVYNINESKLSIDSAVPCGLIINELVSNSFKYAFPQLTNNKRNTITIDFKKHGEKYTLCVKDNGVGIPGDLDIENSESLGLQLVTNLVNQIDGTVEFKNAEGTSICIEFSDNLYHGSEI